jgi:hypothetical protein
MWWASGPEQAVVVEAAQSLPLNLPLRFLWVVQPSPLRQIYQPDYRHYCKSKKTLPEAMRTKRITRYDWLRMRDKYSEYKCLH